MRKLQNLHTSSQYFSVLCNPRMIFHLVFLIKMSVFFLMQNSPQERNHPHLFFQPCLLLMHPTSPSCWHCAHTPAYSYSASQHITAKKKPHCLLLVVTVWSTLMELSVSPVCNTVSMQCVIWPLSCASSQLCSGQLDKPARSHQENQPIRAPDVLPAHAEGNQDPAAFPPWEHHRHQRHHQGTAARQHEGCVSCFFHTC